MEAKCSQSPGRREPVLGSGLTQRVGKLPRGPAGWFARMRRVRVHKEAGVRGYDPLRCSACSGIIGVYEPLVVRIRGEDRASSLAAEPALPLAGAEHFHLVCAQVESPLALAPSLAARSAECASGGLRGA